MPQTRPSLMLSLCALALCAAPALTAAQTRALPDVGMTYTIRASLEPDTRMIDGRVVLTWVNPSSEPVARVPLHLHLNGFAHQGTTWMREGSLNRFPIDRHVRQHPDYWGYSAPSRIAQVTPDGAQAAAWTPWQPDDGNPHDRSLVRVALPRPVGPGETLTLEVDFTARLPVPIARTGGRDDYFLGAQWFPKLGVLESRGTRGAREARWAVHQFHGATEFYADFADFDVTLETPAGWTVGATGSCTTKTLPDTPTHQQTRCTQRAVHDVAFVAGRALDEATFTHTPRGGGPPVRIRYIMPRDARAHLPRWRRAIEGAMDVLGERVGAYPYEDLTVVMPPFHGARTCGMEYPTFITGFFADPALELPMVEQLRMEELVLIHEFGHQYFYGLLATHEQEEAFLDEGFNSYWEAEIMQTLYGEGRAGGEVLGRAVSLRDMRALRMEHRTWRLREALAKQPSWMFHPGTVGDQIYGRPALSLMTVKAVFGREALDRVFAAYFARFAFTHPGWGDFLDVAREVGPPGMAALLREAFAQPHVPDWRVISVSAEVWEPPIGRVVEPDGAVVIVTPSNRAEHPHAGLDPAAWERDGRVTMELRDPGYVFDDARQTGRVIRAQVAPGRWDAPERAHGAAFYTSEALIHGPGWAHLPVRVRLRFSDGVELIDRWDGRASWRQYRFTRPGALVEVQLDPEEALAVDVTPQNNGLRAEPDALKRAEWSAWVAAVVQWLTGGGTLWL